MNPTTLVEIAVVIVVLVLAVVLVRYLATRHGKRDFSRFGPEYDRLVKETGSREKAEAKLLEREQRVSAYHLHALDAAAASRFTGQWHEIEAEFIDDPKAAVDHADRVLTDVIAEQGYPKADFDRLSADLAIAHPVVAQDYREAHAIVARQKDGKASTEDLRQAMIHYKALFAELVAHEEPRRAA